MYVGNIDAILCNTEYERGVERPDGRYSYDLYSFDEKSYEGGIRGTSWTDRSKRDTLYLSSIFVAEQMDDELSVCTALLHDVIEDTEITFEDLTGEFPEEVVEALRCLTRDKNMNYFDYIRKLRKNPIAKKVKQADLLHNSDVTRLSDCENMSAEQISRLHGRYKRALEILHDAR